MWKWIKNLGRRVGKKLGLIENLQNIRDHKKINVDEATYQRIDFNKRMYQGEVKEWHDLRYNGSTGKEIHRKQKTLNMPKVLAKKMARLVFNEGVNISLAKDSEGKEAQWALIDGVVTSNKFIREFQRYLEYMFAMGGVAVEIYLDGEEPKLAYATADAFFPLSSDTEQVDEAVIANRFHEDGYYYTLLKWHEWGEWEVSGDERNYRIKNELYRSKSADSLGEKVGLRELYEDMEPETYFTTESSYFVYIKPNEANNKDITSPLGISIYENVKDTIQMLDVMYDFWYNEFRLGKRRVAVPEYLLKTSYDANGKPYVYFDDSEELFVAMNASEMDEMKMKDMTADLTVDLRVEQVVNSIQSLLDVLAMQTGLSAGTFTFTQGGLKTATEVVSENSETYQTRSSHINVIEDALRDLIVKIYEVATLDNPTAEPLERMDISIDFNDGVFSDSQSLFKFWSEGYSRGLVPQEEAIKRIYKLSDEEAQEWIAKLNQDEQRGALNQQQAIAEAELRIER